jgi:hypothetical protein
VFRQSPEGDQPQPEGTTITIFVSTYVEPTEPTEPTDTTSLPTLPTLPTDEE